MIRGIISLVTGCLVVFAGFSGRAETKAEAVDTPDFKEVYDALRVHLTGVNETELNRAAVEGLISALHGKVSLVTNGESSRTSSAALPVSRSTLLEGDIAYLRVEKVSEGLANAVQGAYTRLTASNKLKGIVL